MAPRRITVGVPVWKGLPHIIPALECLKRQTFTDFDVIISVDGNDSETTAACQPFLSDERFRLVTQPRRLDWFGNFNWLLQQPMGEFFCYRQHDDTTSDNFFEILLRAAEEHPNAAAVFADCQWQGTRSDIEAVDSIVGNEEQRVLTYLEKLDAPPVRGLIRSSAARAAGHIRSDEFRGLTQIFTWLAKVIRYGDFIRVPQAIYYRLDHKENFHKSWYDWTEDQKRVAWATLYSGFLEATFPLFKTDEEFEYINHLALDRVSVGRHLRPTLYFPPNASSAARLRQQCVERLAYELEHGLCDPALQRFLPVDQGRTKWLGIGRSLFRR